MSAQYDSFDFEIDGLTFTATLYEDRDHGAPWEEHDGHGPVSGWTQLSRLPGERVLAQDSGSFVYYDFAAAIKSAKAAGWNAEPYAPEGDTAGKRALRAVERDFAYLKSWCDNIWCYCGVAVTCKDFPDFGEESLWGIESYDDDYIKETAHELASELLTRQITQIEKAIS